MTNYGYTKKQLMKNILVPIGVSKHASTTLRYALSLSKEFGSTVYAIDAYPTHTSKTSLVNIKARLDDENYHRIVQMVSDLGDQAKAIKIVRSERDLIGTIEDLQKSIGLDLIVVAPLNNDIDNEKFLGRIAGSVIKRTSIPVLVAPSKTTFDPPSKILLAFKDGQVKENSTLTALTQFQDHFKAKLNLLLVRVPGFTHKNHRLSDAFTSLSEGLKFSKNGTVYQGVLEHFHAYQPDLLVVFKRERGFFEKLWESDVVYKKDFYCTIPLLVLKNRE